MPNMEEAAMKIYLILFLINLLIPAGLLRADVGKEFKLTNSSGLPLKVFTVSVSKPGANSAYPDCPDCNSAKRVWQVNDVEEVEVDETKTWTFDQDICVAAWNDDREFFDLGSTWKFPNRGDSPIKTTWIVDPDNHGARKVYYRNESGELVSVVGVGYPDISKKLLSSGVAAKEFTCRYTSVDTHINLGSSVHGNFHDPENSESYSSVEVVNLSDDTINIAHTSASRMSFHVVGILYYHYIDYVAWTPLESGESMVLEMRYEETGLEDTIPKGFCLAVRRTTGEPFAAEGAYYKNPFINDGFMKMTASWEYGVLSKLVANPGDPSGEYQLNAVDGLRDISGLMEEMGVRLGFMVTKENCRFYDAVTQVYIK